jgi:hypothetical protein
VVSIYPGITSSISSIKRARNFVGEFNVKDITSIKYGKPAFPYKRLGRSLILFAALEIQVYSDMDSLEIFKMGLCKNIGYTVPVEKLDMRSYRHDECE